MKIKNILFFAVMFVLFTACGNKEKSELDSYRQTFKINLLTREQLVKIILSKDSTNFILIDVRNPHDFQNGHMPGAVSIPSKKAFDKSYKDVWNSDKIKIIYGNDASDAVLIGYWASFNGYDNIFVASGGYDYIYNHILKSYSPFSGYYDDETSLYDYARVLSETAGSSSSTENTQNTPQVQVPVVNNKTEEASGGCE